MCDNCIDDILFGEGMKLGFNKMLERGPEHVAKVARLSTNIAVKYDQLFQWISPRVSNANRFEHAGKYVKIVRLVKNGDFDQAQQLALTLPQT